MVAQVLSESRSVEIFRACHDATTTLRFSAAASRALPHAFTNFETFAGMTAELTFILN